MCLRCVLLCILALWLLSVPLRGLADVGSAADSIIDPSMIRISGWDVLVAQRQTPEPPAADDPGWAPMASAVAGPGYLPPQSIRWFRADFTLGWHHKTRDLAISIGALRGADQVYVNGHRIGATGGFVGGFFAPAAKTRVYRLPKQRLWFSLLDFERSNQLLIGVRSDVEPLDVAVDEVAIGDYEVLALRASDADTGIKIAQGAAITLLVLLALFSLFLRLNGYSNRSNNLFGLFVLVLALSVGTSSLLLYDLGIRGSLIRNLGLGLDFLSLLLFVRLVRSEIPATGTVHYRVLEASGLALLATFVLSPTGWHAWLETGLEGLMVLLALVALVDSLQARRRRGSIDRYVLVALLVVVVGTLIDPFWVGTRWPLSTGQAASTCAAVVLLYDVANKFKAMTLSVQSLAGRLVSIREKERARLTRDIHDGVGQGLSTLKLFITLNMSKLEPELGATLKQEVDRTSETLKSVIRNLKPIEVNSGSPVDALIKLARHLCGLAGIELQVRRADAVTMSPETAYQLYRIGQEALNNAIKHSGASRIELEFRRRRRVFSIQITDNGRGVGEQSGDGLGLSSMSERAQILGGSLEITPGMDGGTRVYLEVSACD